MHLGGEHSWSALGEGYGPAWHKAFQNVGSEDNLQPSLLYFLAMLHQPTVCWIS